MIVHNPQIAERLREKYSREDLQALQTFLQQAGTFQFTALPTGLFPAADLGAAAAAQTGYGNVWVRDNIHVAHALALSGRAKAADRVALALAAFYRAHLDRLVDIVEGRRDPHVLTHRPHIRFNGAELVEDSQIWAHAQNDALGVFVWFYCRRALAGGFSGDFELMELFALFFERIAYWRDADSGHWEERKKVEASSIGCVVAGLAALKAIRAREASPPWRRGLTDAALDRLLERGQTALAEILPWECRGPGILARRYDAALLFLVYPLDALAPEMADQVSADVVENLMGDYGVRRYLGDSYWTADYKRKLDARNWTGDFSLAQESRDRLAAPGEEAQWCLFDPVLSAIAGRRYLRTRERADRERQAFHFNRALGQLTGPEGPAPALRCPEAYYIEDGRYLANDHTPLLWTQANLLAAFAVMRETAERRS